MRERDIYPQDCPRTVRSRRNRFGNTELACSPKYHGAKTAYWAVGRQPGSYPETGFESSKPTYGPSGSACLNFRVARHLGRTQEIPAQQLFFLEKRVMQSLAFR